MPSKTDDPSLLLLARRSVLRWRIATKIFGVCFAISVSAALLLPNTYETRFEVLLPLDTSTSDLANRTAFSSEEIRKSRLNTEIQLITADDILRQVVADSHLEDSIGLTRRPLAVRQQASLQRLEKDLTVSVVRDSNVIEATYESSSPERAADVLRRIFDAYMRSHRVHQRSNRGDQALIDSYVVPRTPSRPPKTPSSAPSRNRTLSLRYQQRSEEARLSAQASEQHPLFDLTVLEQPFTPEFPSSPARGLLLLIAFLGSLLVTGAASLCLEWLSGRVQSPTTIAQVTGVPVLASIPRDSPAPPFADAFPALYLAMQRPHVTFLGRLS